MSQPAPESCPSAAAWLAREWALFEAVESGVRPGAVLTWHTPYPVVVLGRHNSRAGCVREQACRAHLVPVLRRASGGGAVVLGPGCLNYAVVLPLVSRPELQDVGASFAWVLSRLVTAFGVPGLRIEGGTDLALDGLKVSGNAQRRGRRALLHHGTLLHAFDAGLATRYLEEPPRQPAYRAGRPHDAFLGNLPLAGDRLEARLRRGLQDLRLDTGCQRRSSEPGTVGISSDSVG